MDLNKAVELADIMSGALPNEAVTLEILFEACAIMVASAISEALESKEEAMEAFQYLGVRMGVHIAALELSSEMGLFNKGKMN